MYRRAVIWRNAGWSRHGVSMAQTLRRVIDYQFKIGFCRSFAGNPKISLARSGPSGKVYGGGRGIRTPGTLSSTTVFKTAGFNRSPIPPQRGEASPVYRKS